MMKLLMIRHCKHEIKVTRIGDGWNVRCYTNDTLNQEIRVFDRLDIGRAAREMLRWEDKNGNWSDLATHARKKLNQRHAEGVSWVGEYRRIM